MEETVAVQSEISMSVVTEQWRVVQVRQRPRWRWPWRRDHSPPPYHLLDRLQQGGGDQGRPKRVFVNSEPVIFLSCCAFGILGNIYPIFLFWARCIEMFDNFHDRTNNNTTNATEFCEQIANMKDRQPLDMVEADVAEKTIFLQICSSVPSLITAPIFGAWSDYHGRRSPFLLCQFGSLLYLVLITLGSFLYTGTNIYAFLAPAELCFGLFSGIMVFTMASTIIIDECRDKLVQSRSGIPQRIAVACAIQFLGFFLGNTIASFLLSFAPGPNHADTYSRAFLLAAVIFATGLIYTQFWVQESHFPAQTGDDQISFGTHLRHYTLDAFGVLAKKREARNRLCLILTLCFMFVEFMATDNSLMFLVLKQFDWTDAQFSNLMLVRVLLNSLGTITLPLLFRLVPWPGAESLLVMISIAAFGIGSALFAFARTVPQIYALSLLSFLTASISPGFRTILARFVPKAETGRLFALVTLVFILCPLVSKMVFNNFYWATMATWPGMVFLLLAAVHACIFIGQITIHFLMLPTWRSPPAHEEEEASEEDGSATSSSSSADSDRSTMGSTTAEEE